MGAALNGPFGRTALGPGSLTMGRSSDNAIVLNDPQASSRHAEIRPDVAGYVLTDLGSTNGTFINQRRLAPNIPYALKPNDLIRIGSTEFAYEASDSQQDDATIANPNAWNAGNYAPTVGIAPGAYPPNYNPDPAAYPPSNYPQQGFSQPAPNYSQQAYAPPPPNYPNYGTPPEQSYAPPVQPGQYDQYSHTGNTAPGRPVQPERKRHLGGWIALIILLLLAVIVAGGAFYYVNRSTPTKTLQAYCDALKNNDAQEAYNQLSSQTQSRTTQQQFTRSFNTAEQLLNSPLLGGINTCTVGNVQENGSSATGTVVITVNNTTRTFPEKVDLVNENGTWKINNANRPSGV